MLLTLVNKINNFQNIQKMEETSWNFDDGDDDMDWSQWIDNDLSDDVNQLDDPDFIIPEEVAENSISISPNAKKYNLRFRNRLY